MKKCVHDETSHASDERHPKNEHKTKEEENATQTTTPIQTGGLDQTHDKRSNAIDDEDDNDGGSGTTIDSATMP